VDFTHVHLRSKVKVKVNVKAQVQVKVKLKAKFTLEQATKAQRGSRCITPLFLQP
jgi:hypothetical protein